MHGRAANRVNIRSLLPHHCHRQPIIGVSSYVAVAKERIHPSPLIEGCRRFRVGLHGGSFSNRERIGEGRNQTPVEGSRTGSHRVTPTIITRDATIHRFRHIFPLEIPKTTTSSIRTVSTIAGIPLPEFAQSWTIWGGSGILLKGIHHDGLVPYWLCMSLTNVAVRTSLVPLVMDGAKTSARLAKVTPEVQFLYSLFQQDLNRLKTRDDGGKSAFFERVNLFVKARQTLKGIYKLHKVHPFSMFKSPLMQLPVFMYFSVDIRKIVNGGDPALAQELTESGILWITDLTEPDPFFGLPIISGLLVYLNVEMAMGAMSLSGESSSKFNFAKMMKDFFQSLAVFMPCFVSHSPAGVQIYLATSFVFTLFQGMILRHDSFRNYVGLPQMGAAPPKSTLLSDFQRNFESGQESVKAWGGRGQAGEGVLRNFDYDFSFPGVTRPSSIVGSVGDGTVRLNACGHRVTSEITHHTLLCNGSSYPSSSLLSKLQIEPTVKVDEEVSQEDVEYVHQVSDREIEAANLGEIPVPPVQFVPQNKELDNKSSQLNVKSFVSKEKKRSQTTRQSKLSRQRKIKRK